MGKKAPRPPDPVATARAQAELNREAALTSALINQVNQVSPFGQVQWTGEIGSPERTQTTTLSPLSQGLLDRSLGIQHGLFDVILGQPAPVARPSPSFMDMSVGDALAGAGRKGGPSLPPPVAAPGAAMTRDVPPAGVPAVVDAAPPAGVPAVAPAADDPRLRPPPASRSGGPYSPPDTGIADPSSPFGQVVQALGGTLLGSVIPGAGLGIRAAQQQGWFRPPQPMNPHNPNFVGRFDQTPDDPALSDADRAFLTAAGNVASRGLMTPDRRHFSPTGAPPGAPVAPSWAQTAGPPTRGGRRGGRGRSGPSGTTVGRSRGVPTGTVPGRPY